MKSSEKINYGIIPVILAVAIWGSVFIYWMEQKNELKDSFPYLFKVVQESPQEAKIDLNSNADATRKLKHGADGLTIISYNPVEIDYTNGCKITLDYLKQHPNVLDSVSVVINNISIEDSNVKIDQRYICSQKRHHPDLVRVKAKKQTQF
jgi:hypothetical protein